MSEWVSEWVTDKHSQWSDSGPIKIHGNLLGSCLLDTSWLKGGPPPPTPILRHQQYFSHPLQHNSNTTHHYPLILIHWGINNSLSPSPSTFVFCKNTTWHSWPLEALVLAQVVAFLSAPVTEIACNRILSRKSLKKSKWVAGLDLFVSHIIPWLAPHLISSNFPQNVHSDRTSLRNHGFRVASRLIPELLRPSHSHSDVAPTDFSTSNMFRTNSPPFPLWCRNQF